MEKAELFTSDLLTIEVKESADAIMVAWTGKSVTRKPGQFITPILVDVVKKSGETNKRIFLDFRRLDYMNSSTITPIIKVLERAKRGTTPISLIYQRAVKWQDLSFSALGIFETKDRRVTIEGQE
jgi:hypothetical protein